MKPLLALVLIATSLTATAAPADCKVDPPDTKGAEKLTWTGPCHDGWAEGKGVIDARGDEFSGWRYEGEVRHGRPHGHGYMKLDDGREYEGEYVAGRLEGMGIYVSRFGDRYDGSFKNGQRDGRGSMSFSLGGRYDGDWKGDNFNGRGIAEYPGGRKIETTFAGGLPVGKNSAGRCAGYLPPQCRRPGARIEPAARHHDRQRYSTQQVVCTDVRGRTKQRARALPSHG